MSVSLLIYRAYDFRYKGFQDTSDIKGLLLAEASHGNLQMYIDQNNDAISLSLRVKWCQQMTEAIRYIHQKGVIHSDLRPENCLVDASSVSLDIKICDFGGSMCPDLGLDGRGLPDHPFWNMEWTCTPATDIFSPGSIFYTITTGHRPYKSALPPCKEEGEEDRQVYEDRVEASWKQGIYPDMEGVTGGEVMIGCWTKRYIRAEDIPLLQL